jgi:outer membrane lipoprotein-sorting protein
MSYSTFLSPALCLVVLQFFIVPHARADESQILAQWIGAQSAIRTFEADFKQTRELKALTQPLVATGKIWFAAPDRFRWEILQPAPTIAVRDHDELLVIFPKLKRAEKYSLAKLRKGPWKDLMGLLDTGFPRSQSEFEERFHLRSIAPIAGGQRLDIEPKSALVKKYMPQLTIDIGTPGFALLGTTMQFVDGSVLKNEFTQPQLNPDLDDALFHPQLGADYKITEPLSEGAP